MSLTKKYYLITALHNAYFPLGIWVIYFVERWSFSYTQVSLIIATTLFTATLFDLTGGMYADVFGRKKSALIGYSLELLYVSSFIFIDNFFVLIGFAVLGGVGGALISGSLDALVADELGVESQGYKQANAKVQMYLFLSRSGASVVGGYLYLQNLWLPFAAYGVCVLCALLVTSTLVDVHVKTRVEKFSVFWSELWITMTTRKNIFFFCLALLSGTLAGDLLWIYYQPFYSSMGFSGYLLGILFAAISLCSAVGSWIVSVFYASLTTYRVFILNVCATTLNGLLLLSGNGILALIGIMIMAITTGMFEPASRAYLSSVSKHTNRATMFSLGSSMGSIGTLTGFILGGFLLDGALHTVLLLCAIVVASSCFVFVQISNSRTENK